MEYYEGLLMKVWSLCNNVTVGDGRNVLTYVGGGYLGMEKYRECES